MYSLVMLMEFAVSRENKIPFGQSCLKLSGVFQRNSQTGFPDTLFLDLVVGHKACNPISVSLPRKDPTIFLQERKLFFFLESICMEQGQSRN